MFTLEVRRNHCIHSFSLVLIVCISECQVWIRHSLWNICKVTCFDVLISCLQRCSFLLHCLYWHVASFLYALLQPTVQVDSVKPVLWNVNHTAHTRARASFLMCVTHTRYDPVIKTLLHNTTSAQKPTQGWISNHARWATRSQAQCVLFGFVNLIICKFAPMQY